jgi:hypothetical protein
MEDIRCPKQLLDYQTTGKRPEWPLEGLLYRYNSEAETGCY